MSDELFLIDGNSLAYRAFFALPESIATSTGVPTNAIFGFASMLVKILTDYEPRATVVVWDAGHTGPQGALPRVQGAAIEPARPAARSSGRTFEPLVDAFGYRNLRVEGYEADDVIASIAAARRATPEPPIPVMVVTGDRDAYQLVDDGIRIMTTSRGVTDTRVYDREGGDRPLRDPARAGAGLHRAEGRHLATTSPASRGSATRPPPSCCSGSARSRACSSTSTRSRAPSASRT